MTATTTPRPRSPTWRGASAFLSTSSTGNRVCSVVYSNFGIANSAPFAAAFATVPLAIMAVYLLTARRLGAFEHL